MTQDEKAGEYDQEQNHVGNYRGDETK